MGLKTRHGLWRAVHGHWLRLAVLTLAVASAPAWAKCVGWVAILVLDEGGAENDCTAAPCNPVLGIGQSDEVSDLVYTDPDGKEYWVYLQVKD